MRDNVQLAVHSLVICHAPADEEVVRQLAGFLHTNLDIEIAFDPDLPLTEAVERAISAPFALAVFSPDSVPLAWKRAEWEPLFLKVPAEFGCHLAFAQIRDCRFPELLRRERFFDFTAGFLDAARMVRRWLIRPDRPPRISTDDEEMRRSVVDRPGSLSGIDSLNTFFEDCVADFEQTCRINAHGRTPTGIIGETGYQLGLSLPENSARNCAALVEYLRTRRVLLIYDNLAEEHRELVDFGGLATVVTTQGPSPVRSVPDMAGLHAHLEQSLSHGWRVCEFLAAASRYAEKIEVLEWMAGIARAKGDVTSQRSIAHELFFMRDEAAPAQEIRILPSAPTEAGQLRLFE